MSSLCFIDFKRGYLQLVDRKVRGSGRIIFYFNDKYDKTFINILCSKFQYEIHGSDPVWKKERNREIFGKRKK